MQPALAAEICEKSMQPGSSITARAISDAINQRAEYAFGKSAKDSVAVANIENHTADVDYKIRATYSVELISRRVFVNTAQYSLDGIRAALEYRKALLMSNPGQAFRPSLINQLNANPVRVMKPEKFKIASDDHFFYHWETCHGCAGDGSIHCYSCHGHGSVSCGGCYGSGQESCSQCNASGWVGGPQFCGTCGGSGIHVGQRCSGCYGRGSNAHRCPSCNTSRKVDCYRCRGTGKEYCGKCNRGWITCDICDGACNLTHEWNFDIYVETAISYNWSGGQPWMYEHLKAAVNNEENFPSVFHVSLICTPGDDAYRLTGKGYACGATATVTYKGRSSACRFLGAKAIPIDLGGVLSGNFYHVLQLMADPKKLRSIRKASTNTIASALIEEAEHRNVALKSTTPVKSGIITLEQAEKFLSLRKQTERYLSESWGKIKPRAILRFAWVIFTWLTLFYFGVNLLGKVSPGGTQGVVALIRYPGEVYNRILFPYKVALHYGSWPLWTFLIASFFTGMKIVPRVWPKIDYWPLSFWLRVPILILTGSVALSVLLALAPMTVFYFYPPNWIPTGARIGQAINGTFSMIPAIFITSICIALARYKEASKYWIRQQRHRLNF